MSFVDPVRVGELRARLSPAFAALGGGVEAPPELRALAGEGLAWCAAPVGLLDAPAALQRGRALEARLALFRRAPGARVGTILGLPTVGELEDLVAAQKYQLAALEAIKACPGWAAADPAGYGQWAADFYDAAAALHAAIASAEAVIGLTPDAIKNYTPADVPWNAVLAGAHPFTELLRRFMVAGYCAPPDLSAMPQPKNPDVDLAAYKWTDLATKKIEQAATAVASAAGDVLKPVLVAVAVVGVLVVATRGRR